VRQAVSQKSAYLGAGTHLDELRLTLAPQADHTEVFSRYAALNGLPDLARSNARSELSGRVQAVQRVAGKLRKVAICRVDQTVVPVEERDGGRDTLDTAEPVDCVVLIGVGWDGVRARRDADAPETTTEMQLSITGWLDARVIDSAPREGRDAPGLHFRRPGAWHQDRHSHHGEDEEQSE